MTRPWCSLLQNYSIFCQDFISYINISMTDKTFPEIPRLNEVTQILDFEKLYCQSFDKLESVNLNRWSVTSILFISLKQRTLLKESNKQTNKLSLEIIFEIDAYFMKKVWVGPLLHGRQNFYLDLFPTRTESPIFWL